MTTTTIDAQELRGRASQLLAAEHELSATILGLAERIADATTRRGDELLRRALGETPGDEVPDFDALVRERAAAELALSAARERRRGTLQGIFEAEAHGLRTEAGARREAAAAIEAQTRPHLDALREITGAPYGPIVGMGRTTAGELIVAPGQVAPRHVALLEEARLLDERAQSTAGRRPADAGQATGSTLEELLHATNGNALHIGPSVVSVTEWARSAEVAERERRRTPWTQSQGINYADPVAFRLVWRGGEIDTQQSSCGVAIWR